MRRLSAPPPRRPEYCDRHGEETVEVTRFGQPYSDIRCVFCFCDATVSADLLYAKAVERFTSEIVEYDRQTVRIAEIEAEIARSLKEAMA